GALTIGPLAGGVGALLLWGLLLYYLTRTHVKAFFGKGGLPITPAYMVPYSLGPQGDQPQVATNGDYGRPAAVVPQVTFPPISQGSSASISGLSAVLSTPASSRSSSGRKAIVRPYCHSTLPMSTKKCLTCGAAI